jgi:hypothetical protein
MLGRRLLAQLWLALSVVGVGSLLMSSALSAQTTSSGSGPYAIRVDTPGVGSTVSGIAIFTGMAVDCGAARAPSRVSVYDGEASPSRHLGDVTIETQRALADLCPSRAGTVQAGFTFVLDTRRLSAGLHSLVFKAFFANGIERSINHDVTVQNDGSPQGQFAGSVTFFDGAYWVNGSRQGPDYAPPVYYVPTCTVKAANGTCVTYSNVATTNPLSSDASSNPGGQRGYYTCVTFPNYRCNYTMSNGGGMRNR